MKNKHQYILVPVTLLLAVSLAALAQQFFHKGHFDDNDRKELPGIKDEFSKLIAHFMDTNTSRNVSGIIRLYDGEAPETLKETQNFRFYQGKGNAFYSSLSYQQTICNGHIAVMLDTVNKVMLVSKVPVGTPPDAIGGMQLGKLLSDTAQAGITGTVSENGSERSITYSNKDVPEISDYTVVYDKTTYQLKSSEITWWKNGTAMLDSTKKHQVWITKIEYQFGKDAPVDINKTMESMLSIHGDKIAPAAAYSRYEIRTGN